MAEFIDIYAASDLWAAPLVEDYLGQFGIEAIIRPNGVSAYPVCIGPLAGFRIGVHEDDRRVAIRLLAQAIRDRGGSTGHGDRG